MAYWTRQEKDVVHVGERFNSITHLVGAVLSVAGLATLVTMGALDGDPYKVVSFSVYGAMLFVLYAISTLYHSVRNPRVKASSAEMRSFGDLPADRRQLHAVHAGYAAWTVGLVPVRGKLGACGPWHRAGTHARATHP